MQALALGLAGLFAVACGSTPAATPPAQPGGGGAASAAPVAPPPDVVVWEASIGTFTTLDPARNAGTVQMATIRMMYEPMLTTVGADNTIVPLLASSFTASADYKTLTMKLKPNVKFSDGTPMTSADVVFSYHRVKNLKDKGAFLMAGVTATAPDAATVVLTSATPNPGLPMNLTSAYLGILNSKVIKANGGTDAADADKADKAMAFIDKTSAGSGPYTLVSFDTTTSRTEVVPNPAYWGSRKPALKKIIVLKSTNGQAQAQNLEAGVVQIGLDLSPQQSKNLKLEASAKVPAGLNKATALSGRMMVLNMNMDPEVSKVTSNAKFREAFRFAIDYAALANLSGEGSKTPSGLVLHGVPGALPEAECCKQDLTRARAALAASGLTNPTVSMDYATDLSFSGQAIVDFVQIVQKNLEAIGVKVELKGAPNATAFVARGAQGRSEIQVNTTSTLPDPIAYAIKFCPKEPQAVGVNQANPNGWARLHIGLDPETDRNCAAVMAAAPAQRDAAIKTWLTRMNVVGPWAMLTQPAAYVVSDKRLTNVAYSAASLLDWYIIGQVGPNFAKND